MLVKAFTDGSSRGNPGPGGYGVLLEYVDKKGVLHTKEISAGYRLTTNNRMELSGVIAALSALKFPCTVEVVTDSSYVVNPVNKGWLFSWEKNNWMHGKNKEVKNKDLWIKLRTLLDIHDVHFTWVRGHNGHPENERCDALATSAADGEDLLEDTGYKP